VPAAALYSELSRQIPSFCTVEPKPARPATQLDWPEPPIVAPFVAAVILPPALKLLCPEDQLDAPLLAWDGFGVAELAVEPVGVAVVPLPT
jgi:hypothetical protein